MGKFELAPAIDIRLEPIKETFVHSLPHRTFKSWSCRRFDRKRLGLLRVVRDPSYGLRRQAVGRKGCLVNYIDLQRFFSDRPPSRYGPNYGVASHLKTVDCRGRRHKPRRIPVCVPRSFKRLPLMLSGWLNRSAFGSASCIQAIC